MPSLPQEFLASELSTITTPAKMVTISESTSLRDAINILMTNSVSSAPVRSKDAPEDTNNMTSILGMIDVIDVVAFFLEVNQQTKNWDRGFEAVFETVVQFTGHTVGDILNKKESTLRFAQVPQTTTMKEALDLLGPKKTHRLLVVDDNNNIVNIITQSAMLKVILERCPEADLFNVQLNQVLLTTVDPTNPDIVTKTPLVNTGKPLLCLKSTDKAIDAFKIIHAKRITGVAVVDAVSGNMIGNISSRDIRSLVGKDENYENLYSTAEEYINSIQEERVRIAREQEHAETASARDTAQKHSELPPTLTVSAADTVGYVMFSLNTFRIRRMYLTSQKLYQGKIIQCPYGIVTISDIMALCAGCTDSLFIA